MTSPLSKLKLKLGVTTAVGELDAVPRSIGRQSEAALPFFGYDLWNAYEVSFLSATGKPSVYHMQAIYDAHSPNLVESKSFKLYLNARNMTKYADLPAFIGEVRPALEACVGAEVSLFFYKPEHSPQVIIPPVDCLDHLEPSEICASYAPHLLQTMDCKGTFGFKSFLLRSNCPVTNQPDWGTVVILGQGARQPSPASLLAYLISFRAHQDFHEACCETIFNDLRALLEPDRLQVTCYYTRRGGLDINPRRSTHPMEAWAHRPVWRQ